jgi:hypothetical protein
MMCSDMLVSGVVEIAQGVEMAVVSERLSRDVHKPSMPPVAHLRDSMSVFLIQLQLTLDLHGNTICYISNVAVPLMCYSIVSKHSSTSSPCEGVLTKRGSIQSDLFWYTSFRTTL